MRERPRCDLGHELDYIGHNHVDPDQLLEHVRPDDAVGMESMKRTIAARKAFIKRFNEERDPHGSA